MHRAIFLLLPCRGRSRVGPASPVHARDRFHETDSTRQIPRDRFHETDFSIRVTVQFRDGGAPLVVDRRAVLQPYGPAAGTAGVPTSTRLVTIESVLPPSTRKVLSVAGQPMSEGLDSILSVRAMTWAGRAMAAGETGLGAEFTPNAGITWLPLFMPDSARFQATMCITQ